MADRAKIAGIMFDKDGVLVDFDKTWVQVLIDMAKALADGDQSLDAELLRVAGYDNLTGKFLPGSVWAAGNTDDLVAVWRGQGNTFSDQQLGQFIYDKCMACVPVPMFPVVKLQSMFRSFDDRGLKLAIATNDMEDSAVATMENFGLTPYLTSIIGYDSVVNPKPASDPVVAFCKKTGLESKRIAMVGDNVHDMEMARAGGTGLAIGVLTGNSSANDLSPFADYLIDNVLELPNLLAEKMVL